MGIFKEIEALWRRHSEINDSPWLAFGGQTGDQVDVPSMQRLLAAELARARRLAGIEPDFRVALEAAQNLDTPEGRASARGIFRNYLHRLGRDDGDLLSEEVGMGLSTEVDIRATSCWRAMQLIDSLAPTPGSGVGEY